MDLGLPALTLGCTFGMSTPKTPVRFMPSLPKAQTPASSPTPQQKPQPKPSVVQDDLLIERPTILRVKRRRDELLNDSIGMLYRRNRDFSREIQFPSLCPYSDESVLMLF